MPRKQSLQNMSPNRHYSIEATLKYKHETEGYTTAIIEEDEVQRKIKIPQCEMDLEEGNTYKFQNCYYSKNGWLRAKNPNESIENMQHSEVEPMTLSKINQFLPSLLNNYLTTLLYVVEVSQKQIIHKNGKELTLIKMKCFYDNFNIDVTLWNRDVIKEELEGKLILLRGFRIKMLTEKAWLLVSSVYSSLEPFKGMVEFTYNSQQKYVDLSSVYQHKSLDSMLVETALTQKSFSILNVHLSNAQIFEYEGCTLCHKKAIQTIPGCICGNSERKSFEVVRLMMEDDTTTCEGFVFDHNVQNLLKYVTSQALVAIRVNSSLKINEEGSIQMSHVINSVEQIKF